MRRSIRRTLDRVSSRTRVLSRVQEGQGLAEYSLILAFVALVCIGALTALGQALPPFFQQVANAL